MTDDDTIEKIIGQRFRAIRLQQRQTLQALATALGVSYQQIRKYETGQNRISAGMLYRSACALNVDVVLFFGETKGSTELTASQPGTVQDDLTRALHRIDDPDVRQRLADLIRVLDTAS